MYNNLNKFVGSFVCLFAMTLASTPALSDDFKTSDDVVINYEIKGKGDPFLLLHSGMMSRDDMRLQIDYFSKHFKVIALDSREQGRSSASSAQITYDLMARDAIQLLDHLNIKKTNIFGQSDGGNTALLLTLNYPHRVNQLIIHGANYNYKVNSSETIEGLKNINWNANNSEDTDPTKFPGMAIKSYLLGHNDLSGFERHLQEMARMWASEPTLSIEELKKNKVPTLIIVGDHFDIPLNHTLEMYKALGNSQLFVAPNETHYIHKENPVLLHNIIMEFLKN